MLLQKLILIILILMAALSRLIPHPPNFTPIIAMGLLGGVYFKNKHLAIIIPLMAMFISDIWLGLHATMIWVYSAIAIVALLSSVVKPKFIPLVCASLCSALFFFIVTNFGVWITSSFYPKTFVGLNLCFAAGLPFLKHTILGNIFYTTVLFSIIELIKFSYPKLRFSSHS